MKLEEIKAVTVISQYLTSFILSQTINIKLMLKSSFIQNVLMFSFWSFFPSAAVWDFRVLLVKEGLTSDLLELHSTPWSSVRPLDPRDRRVQDFHPPRPARTGASSSSSLELDLDTLLSQKYSGESENT